MVLEDKYKAQRKKTSKERFGHNFPFRDKSAKACLVSFSVLRWSDEACFAKYVSDRPKCFVIVLFTITELDGGFFSDSTEMCRSSLHHSLYNPFTKW